MSREELQREKLLNAIVFFTKKTKHCHTLKLFKLLYFLDFEMFRTTGRSTTGLTYLAFPMGPVPARLYDELKAPRADFSAAVLIASGADFDPDFGRDSMTVFKARRAFDDGCFTQRELDEMERLAEIYFEAHATAMTLASHERGLPWRQVYEIEKRPQAPIPYELALDNKPDSITKQQAELIAEAERELAAMFK